MSENDPSADSPTRTRDGRRREGSQIVMDGRAMRSTAVGREPRQTLRVASRSESHWGSRILVTLARLDGELLHSETISGDARLMTVARAAARKMGGRPVQLFMNDQRLDHDHTALQCGIADGCVLTAMPTNAVMRVFATEHAFCALQADGAVMAWGNEEHGGALGTNAMHLSRGVKQIFASENAFIAVKDDGKLVSWGSRNNLFEALDDSVLQIVLAADEFACLTVKGYVLVVGKDEETGDKVLVKKRIVPGRRVVSLYTTDKAFAALTNDGGVAAWGDASCGGDVSKVKKQLKTGVRRIVAGSDAFAALKLDHSVVTWGNLGETTPKAATALAMKLSGGVKEVFAAGSALVAVKTDCSVVMWGTCKCLMETRSTRGSVCFPATLPCRWCMDRSDLEEQISQSGGLLQLVAAKRAFAGLCVNGSVITWGDAKVGGLCCTTHNAEEQDGDEAAQDDTNAHGSRRLSQRRDSLQEYRDVSLDLSMQVVHLVASDWAFAALRSGGDVVSWGDDRYGGSTARVHHLLRSNVKEVVANAYAFAALRGDGSVVTWGHSMNGGCPEEETAAKLTDGVVQLASTRSAFTALKADGTIVTWGHARFGGDSTGVRMLIQEDVHDSTSEGDDVSKDQDKSTEAQKPTDEPGEKDSNSLRMYMKVGKILRGVRKRMEKRNAVPEGDLNIEELKVPSGIVSRVYGIIKDDKAKTKSDEVGCALPNLVLHSSGKPVSAQKKLPDRGDPPRMVKILPSCRPLKRAAPRGSQGCHSNSGKKNRRQAEEQAITSIASSRCDFSPIPFAILSDGAESDSITAIMAMARQEARSCPSPPSPPPGQSSRTCTLSPHLFSPQLDRADTDDWPTGTSLALQLDSELPELPGQPRDGQTHTGAVHWLTEVFPEVLALRRQMGSTSPKLQKHGTYLTQVPVTDNCALLPVLPGASSSRGDPKPPHCQAKEAVKLPSVLSAIKWL